jgi:hypothetical protein
MANQDRPSGLAPVQYLNGSPWNGGGRVYCIPDSDDSNAYAIGDPVVLAGSADARGVPTITLATAGSANSVLGPIVSGAGSPVYAGAYGVPAESPIVIPAVKTRNYYVLVCDDPNVIFEIQEEDLGTAFTADDVGFNANLSSGVNNGYLSGWEIDTASPGAGATLQLKLLGLSQKNNNDFGDWAKWLVLINLHCYRIGQVGY